MSFKDWSITAGDNDDADGDINWAEGQAPSSVNGSARAMMANLKIALGHILSIDDFTVNGDGVTSDVTPFQNAMSELSDRGGGQLIIPKATYLFTVASDADSILIPSNVGIWCEPGVVFKWGFWGSPLFAIVNKTNVRFHGNGAKFIWTGTFSTTTGNADKFSYGADRPAYEWIAHIVSAGSENVTIDDVECAGEATSNNINNFILMLGKSDGSLTVGNTISKVMANDVGGQVIAIEGQKNWLIEDVRADRYDDASSALYGPGHVIYHTSHASTNPGENGIIRDVEDYGTMLGAYVSGSQTISVKEANYVQVRGVLSKRAEGCINFEGLKQVSFAGIRYYTDSTTDNTDGASVFGVDSTIVCEDVSFDGVDIVHDAQRDMSGIALAHSVGTENLRMHINNLRIIRNCDGTESTPAVLWCGNYGTIRNFTHINRGSGTQRAIINARNTSNDNVFHVMSMGTVTNPRVAVTSGSRNTFFCRGDSTVDFDSNEFTPSSGNAVIWESSRQYQSSSTIGSTTNPSDTFTLPVPGAYLVHVTLISSDANHARSELFWVVFDNASVNDYTTAQTIGTAITKGGSAPSAMSLAVDNAGVCTLTSTAGSNTWIMRYGYRQLSAD